MFKQFFENKEVVIFDLDGTIVPTGFLWNEAFKQVYENLGYDWRGKNFISGGGTRDVWEDYLDYESVTPEIPFSEIVNQTHSHFLRLLADSDIAVRDGFWRFIDELKNREFKLGLVTNTDRDVAEKVIDRVGISQIFDFEIFGDDVKKKKPDPEIYKKSIKESGVKPWKILVFEDSPTGAKSADKAGLETIVLWEPGISPNQGDYPRGILEFVPDFSPFIGNLDLSTREYYEKLVDSAQKTTQEASQEVSQESSQEVV